MNRIEKIAKCMREIEKAISLQSPGAWYEFLYEMDQRNLLHHLIYEEID